MALEEIDYAPAPASSPWPGTPSLTGGPFIARFEGSLIVPSDHAGGKLFFIMPQVRGEWGPGVPSVRGAS